MQMLTDNEETPNLSIYQQIDIYSNAQRRAMKQAEEDVIGYIQASKKLGKLESDDKLFRLFRKMEKQYFEKFLQQETDKVTQPSKGLIIIQDALEQAKTKL